MGIVEDEAGGDAEPEPPFIVNCGLVLPLLPKTKVVHIKHCKSLICI